MHLPRPILALLVVSGVVLGAAACGDARAADSDDGPPATAPDNSHSSSFVGLTVDEAAARAEGQSRPWRIIHQDGEDLIVTEDYSEDRLNLTVVDGVVTDAATDAELVGNDN